MPQLQVEAIEVMTTAFREMEVAIPQPQKTPYKSSFVYRYAHKGIHEALLQKLVRCISGLNAVESLISAGFAQEACVLLRTLDEIQEDIFFLATAETNNAYTERHEKYLEAFFSEPVFSRPKGSLEIPKPNLVPRKKIRAHTVKVLGNNVDASALLTASEALSTAYSGYVHAASENIMEMYGGDPPHFYLDGMRGTPRIASTTRDAENYVYRGLMATITVAKAFGDASLVERLYQFLTKYESANGHNVASPPRAGT